MSKSIWDSLKINKNLMGCQNDSQNDKLKQAHNATSQNVGKMLKQELIKQELIKQDKAFSRFSMDEISFNKKTYYKNYPDKQLLENLSKEQQFKKISNFEDQKQNQYGHSKYFDRELSWLSFNRRVLAYAYDATIPLLERMRFLSISANNFEEFVMVRIAGIFHSLKSKHNKKSFDRQAINNQLGLIVEQCKSLLLQQQICWCELKILLEKNNHFVLKTNDLDKDDLKYLSKFFEEQMLSILTPLIIDLSMPIPFIPNKGFVLYYELQGDGNDIKHVLIPLPQSITRFVSLPKIDVKSVRVIAIEEIISHFIDKLYPDYIINKHGSLRILRDSDIELEEEAEDLVKLVETIIRRRKRGEVIFLKISKNPPKFLLEFLSKMPDIANAIKVEVDGLLGLCNLDQLILKDNKKLLFDPFVARYPERIKEFSGDCFTAIANKDILVHHPYESFLVVVDFLMQAAKDDDVVAIKQTLYRTSNQSPIVEALIKAAKAGKSVTAIIELQARFDEEANLIMARKMERAGVHLVYGKRGYKIHAKLSLILKKQENGIKPYVHIGTGNYHPITANIYTDLSLFTCNKKIAYDVAKVFHYITGNTPVDDLKSISMAPVNLRSQLMKLIDNEIDFAKAGKPASIWIKVNSIVDKKIIKKLYQASNKGVKINIICRGICCLKPGVKGMSDNIMVKSIIGRFLEHSRIYCFGNGFEMPNNNSKVFISSADLMTSKLDKRVEVMCHITNETVHKQILEQIMLGNINDNCLSWKLNYDGTYIKIIASDTGKEFNTHKYFMTNPSLSGRGLSIDSDAPEILLK